VVEQFFRQTLEAQRATQEQWARFLQNTVGWSPPAAPDSASPLDWMSAFIPNPSPRGERGAASDERRTVSDSPSADARGADNARSAELDELRRELAALTRRMEELAKARAPDITGS
jgi:hypothetical protein